MIMPRSGITGCGSVFAPFAGAETSRLRIPGDQQVIRKAVTVDATNTISGDAFVCDHD